MWHGSNWDDFLLFGPLICREPITKLDLLLRINFILYDHKTWSPDNIWAAIYAKRVQNVFNGVRQFKNQGRSQRRGSWGGGGLGAWAHSQMSSPLEHPPPKWNDTQGFMESGHFESRSVPLSPHSCRPSFWKVWLTCQKSPDYHIIRAAKIVKRVQNMLGSLQLENVVYRTREVVYRIWKVIVTTLSFFVQFLNYLI